MNDVFKAAKQKSRLIFLVYQKKPLLLYNLMV